MEKDSKVVGKYVSGWFRGMKAAIKILDNCSKKGRIENADLNQIYVEMIKNQPTGVDIGTIVKSDEFVSIFIYNKGFDLLDDLLVRWGSKLMPGHVEIMEKKTRRSETYPVVLDRIEIDGKTLEFHKLIWGLIDNPACVAEIIRVKLWRGLYDYQGLYEREEKIRGIPDVFWNNLEIRGHIIMDEYLGEVEIPFKFRDYHSIIRPLMGKLIAHEKTMEEHMEIIVKCKEEIDRLHNIVLRMSSAKEKTSESGIRF